MLDIGSPEVTLDAKPRIVVIGVGGAGGNAIENMMVSGIDGCEFVVCNTDAQALKYSNADTVLQLGGSITNGLGAGSDPEIGRKTAEESVERISECIDKANMVFIAAGMGGGTGTGASPVIARLAREKNILTVGVVTKPFEFEGVRRMQQAERGISELQKSTDTVIVIPNQNLFYETVDALPMTEAFKIIDGILCSGVQSITNLIIKPGLINLDFNDIRTVMLERGKAVMGTGEASGKDAALCAAENAINNKLLDDDNMKGAKAVLLNITANSSLSLTDVNNAANRVRQEVASVANIIFGTTFDDTLDDIIRVSIIATGIQDPTIEVAEDPSLLQHSTGKIVADSEKVSLTSDGASQSMSADTGVVAQSMVKSVEEIPANDHRSQDHRSRPQHSFFDMHGQDSAETSKNNTSAEKEESAASSPQKPIDSRNADPFVEADLANAVRSNPDAQRNKTLSEKNQEHIAKTGGFFKRLFDGIKGAEDKPTRHSESVATHFEQKKHHSVARDFYRDIEYPQITEDDIPEFLRKKID